MAEDHEKKTPVFDWIAGDFATDLQGQTVTATGEAAVKEVVVKALQSERGLFLIYADVENSENDHIYGSEVAEIMTRADLPEDVRIEEIKRAIKETLIYHEWINDVYDIVITRRTDGTKTITNTDGSLTEIGIDEVYADFWVKHIFGTSYMEGVNVYNG